MSATTQLAPTWSPLVLVTLAVLALAAASLDGALAARAAGVAPAIGARGPLTSAARLMRQRRRTTLSADAPLWRLGGGGLLVAAALMVAVVPFGPWTLSDQSVGLVWFNAMDVLVWALVWLAGWGPNSALALVGAYRWLAQALAYELPLMFALATPALGAASLRMGEIAAAQSSLWFVVWMPVAFAVYCTGVAAFSVQGPFAAAAGADVAGGVLAELSGVDRLLLLAGRWALLAAGALGAVPLFLGGGSGPGSDVPVVAALWTVLKAVAVIVLLVVVRRRVPLLRPDKLLEVGWLVLLPAALLQLLVVSVVVVVRG